MTPEELAAIRARAEAATPGPWTVDEGLVWDDGTGECECQWYREIRGWTDHGVPCDAGYLVLSREDATFIAHAREDIPRLLDEVEALRARADQLRQQVAELEAWGKRVLADAQGAWRRYHAVRIAADGLREELERLVLSHHATLEEGLQCDRCEDAVNEILDYDALAQ
ncbi:MAG: hypothetical protein IRY92_10550 [Dactylosporangium sp.]|nr:hypothetical protein [Dactylosporangium sp.]